MMTNGTSSLGMILFIGIVNLGVCSELDTRVVKYLEAIADYKTIEFQSEVYSSVAKGDGARKRLGGLPLLKRYEGFVDVSGRSYRYKETVYIDDKSTSVIRHRSWIDGLLQEFQDPNSSEFTNRHEAGGGVILEKSYHPSTVPTSPMMAIGFDVTAFCGDPIHLWDLISKKPPVDVSHGRYLIENVFDWDPSFGAAYDLEFVLSETDGYLPKSIHLWDRTFGKGPESKVIFAEIEVNRFGKVGGQVVPIDFLQKGPGQRLTRVVLDVAKISLNREFTTDDYRLPFPADHWYVDQRTRIKYENGKEIKLEPIPEAPSLVGHRPNGFWNGRWLLTGILSIVVLFLLFIVGRKRGLFTLLMCLGLSYCSGCHSDTTTSNSMEIEISREAALSIVGGVNRDVRIPIGGKEQTTVIEVELKNTGSIPIELSRNIRTTCGCMEAFVEQPLLQPQMSTVLIARIENARIPGNRVVTLAVSVVGPKPCEIPLTVNTIFQGDWYLDPSTVTLNGLVGSKAEQAVKVFGPSNVIENIRWESTGDLEIQEASAERLDSRVFVVKSQITELYSGQKAGTVHFYSSLGEPSSADVHVRKFGSPAASWTPMAISLGRLEAKSVELKLADGIDLRTIESDHCHVEWVHEGKRVVRVKVARKKKIEEHVIPTSVPKRVEPTVLARILVDGNEQVVRLPVLFEGNQND